MKLSTCKKTTANKNAKVFVSQQKMLQMLADAIKNNPNLVSRSYEEAAKKNQQTSEKSQ
ncbi:hypothetical protein ACSVJ5_002594 [Vibrio vulnificus]|uniref:hypothetical protein n=1 Tax=Vibrio vulnificus TaxID=672 RepID=UPI00163D073E|nr:hypothetical protein [Vibrio vulnificus]QNE00557.1 hypothetical protein H6S61_13800 [Vibrio vulnificus]